MEGETLRNLFTWFFAILPSKFLKSHFLNSQAVPVRVCLAGTLAPEISLLRLNQGGNPLTTRDERVER